MDLKTYKFPKISAISEEFSTQETDKKLLEEAKKRGFYDGQTPYNTLFSKVLFSGGRVVFKKDVDQDFQDRAWLYFRALIKSWSPKHEEKEAVCAMIMSELVEPELAKD